MSTGGGGGSSGKVEYPAFMQETLSDWLNKGSGSGIGSDTIESSVTEVMNAALGASPFAGKTAHDPTSDFTDAEVFLATLQNLNTTTTLSSVLASFATVVAAVDSSVVMPTADDATAKITADVAAYSAMLDNEINVKVLPKFRRGMQDINAVMSSAFVIGEAVIWAERTRDVAKFAADIELREFDHYYTLLSTVVSQKLSLYSQVADLQFRGFLALLEWYRAVAQFSIEFARIKTVALKEQVDQDIEIEEKDGQWDLRVFQYGGNLLASISGASATTNSKPNTLMSALGGALSGASAGASMGTAIGGATGGPIGAGVGAILGGLASLF